MFSLHSIRWCMITVCFIIADVKFEHLIKMVPARFLHYKIAPFLFVGMSLYETKKIPQISSNFQPLVLTSVDVY